LCREVPSGSTVHQHAAPAASMKPVDLGRAPARPCGSPFLRPAFRAALLLAWPARLGADCGALAFACCVPPRTADAEWRPGDRGYTVPAFGQVLLVHALLDKKDPPARIRFPVAQYPHHCESWETNRCPSERLSFARARLSTTAFTDNVLTLRSARLGWPRSGFERDRARDADARLLAPDS